MESKIHVIDDIYFANEHSDLNESMMKDKIIVKKALQLPTDVCDTTYQMERIVQNFGNLHPDLQIAEVLKMDHKNFRVGFNQEKLFEMIKSRSMLRKCIFIRNFNDLMYFNIDKIKLLDALQQYDESYIFFHHKSVRDWEKMECYKDYRQFYADVESGRANDPFVNMKSISRMSIEECYKKITGLYPSQDKGPDF